MKHEREIETANNVGKTLERIKIFLKCEDLDATQRAVSKMRREFDELDFAVNEAKMRENV